MAKILSEERVLEYTKEFKYKVVELTEKLQIKTVDVAEIFDLHPVMVYRWRQEYRDGKLLYEPSRRISMTKEKAPKKATGDDLKELKALRKENTRLQKENDILKVASVSSGNKAEKFMFIDEYGAALGVRYLCYWLMVSPQGFYKWRNREESHRAKENRWLTEKIKHIYTENHGNYGCPRVYTALRTAGIEVNYKRVERIMREEGLVGKAAKLYRRKAAVEPFYMKHPNLTLELPALSATNQQWAGDITYLKVRGEWRYLAVVMDLYSRRIIGWSLGNKKNAELTRSSLLQAINSRRIIEGLIFHTDRGSEYGAYHIQKELDKYGIRSSMNRPEAMNDNIYVETFFRTLKTECYHGVEYKDEKELRKSLVYYLDDYYNRRRIHTSIGSQPPIQFENENLVA